MGTGFVLAHQAAETNHIRMQNGGQLPIPTTVFQDLSHRCLENKASHPSLISIAKD
jgi:hypothetical protein